MSVNVFELATDDPDLAHETLNQLYAEEYPIKYSGDGGDFDFRVKAYEADGLHAGYIKHTMPTNALIEPFDTFLAGTLLSGSIDWAADGQQAQVNPGGVARYSVDGQSELSWNDLGIALIRIPRSAIDRLAYLKTDPLVGQVRFTDISPTSEAGARRWRSMTEFVHASLSATTGTDNALVRAQLVDLVAATAAFMYPSLHTCPLSSTRVIVFGR